MQEASLHTYAHLRVLVGYLGEAEQDSWWPTQFFTSSSKLFLGPVVPRTVQLAKYNGVLAAARNLHDEYIGVGKVMHLFRLPEEVEQDLQSVILAPPDNWFEQMGDRDSAIASLRSIAGEGSIVQEGPQAVGSFERIYQSSGAKLLAQSYLSAFEQGIRTFPYFTC